ncbi:LysR family transcriptional regulator [Pseudomonas aeruginosa]|uniref:helix-turn-helix domain-containing protein n=1 Tax=Pseudomonas aeruginosa TaxID=287 RepID=UPI002ACB0B54|nr:LysR family transcriptional regulator [Pseudomonas aeruginosa]MCE2589641.1 LysR family transcriptional regulator [Pseudomonas aeruginosa]
MLRLDDMEIFVEVVRQNSLRKAAEKLKIPVSTLSRRLSVLEKEIGVRLIRRTTRRGYRAWERILSTMQTNSR